MMYGKDMFEGYEWKSIEFQNKLEEKGIVNNENKEILGELLGEFYAMEQLMLMYKNQRDEVSSMRDRFLKMKNETIEYQSNRIHELEKEIEELKK